MLLAWPRRSNTVGKHNLGVLLGSYIIVAGRNTSATITPALAINFWRSEGGGEKALK